MKLLLLPLCLSFCFIKLVALQAQSNSSKIEESVPLFSLQMPDTLHSKRFWVSATAGVVIYSSVSIALWNSWYKSYPTSRFHLFDDRGEWQHMDKLGHSFTTYNEARWLFNGARWTGINKKKSALFGFIAAMALQSTVEIMDGYSQKWGFSWADMGFNLIGGSLFLGQEYLWQDQKIVFKISSNSQPYPSTTIVSSTGQDITLDQRAKELYGESYVQRFLKDYNAQTIWISANIASLLPKNPKFLPSWLNLAFGYGAQNMYAGFGYTFDDNNGGIYLVDEINNPRFSQYYLSLDVDLTRIPTKKRWLQTAFSILNFIKIPAPTLEYNKYQGLKTHWLR